MLYLGNFRKSAVRILYVSNKMTIQNFDTNFVIDSFQCCNLKFYLDMLHPASKDDLISLRQEIEQHGKNNRQSQAFTNVQNFSTHDALISAINHELLKRSYFYPFYKFIFKLRAPIVKVFTGLELNENEYFGFLYSQPKHLRHYYLHMSHKDFFPVFGRFLIRHWRFILTTIVAITFGILQLRK